jgi:hypothetical protein
MNNKPESGKQQQQQQQQQSKIQFFFFVVVLDRMQAYIISIVEAQEAKAAAIKK